MAREAVVIGAGIAGLSAGIAFKRAGYDVTVFEQAEEIAPMGAALSIWGNAMAGLDWLGCGDAVRAHAARIDCLQLTDTRNRNLFGPVDVADTDSYLCLRRHLQTILLDMLGPDALRLDVRADDAVQDGERVQLVSKGETLTSADLLVVADGIHSRIATRLLGNPPRYAGYHGVLGLGADPPHQQHLAEEVWGEDERFGVFDHGAGTYWFYMRSGPETGLAALSKCTVAQQAMAFPDYIRHAVDRSDGDTMIPVAIASRPMPGRLGEGRIVCIGDAAHAMEPNQGQGACQGIEDAWALGVLSQRLGPADILPELERLRFRRISRAHKDSARIGQVIHGGNALVGGAVRGLFRAIPSRLDAMQIRQRIAPPDYA